MSSFEKSLVVGIGIVGMLVVCCLGAIFGAAVVNNQENGGDGSGQTAVTTQNNSVAQSTPLPSPTAVPTLPSVELPEIAPNDTNLAALSAYAEAIKPILEEGLTVAERDGQILEAGKENPDALCGGNQVAHSTLAADAAVMDRLLTELGQVDAPGETAVHIHKPLTESLRLWAEALDNLNKSCETAAAVERDLLRVGASLQAGGAILNFHVASDNFWRLLVVYGLEAITR
ncbi:hypothetical protein [Candidatus Leptofilum sp.]|uniref:hypothetical protein n=1 Tax=Candidatus Leptofilum sp. TaxID=3241576 RepID=UPI003B5CB015